MLDEILLSTKNFVYLIKLNFLELKIRYRRSFLGPIWITLSTLILVLSISFIFSSFFGVQAANFTLYFGLGFIIWTFAHQSIIESCSIFISKESAIKNSKHSLINLLMSLLIRNFIIFLHNLSLLPFFLVISDLNINLFNLVLFIFGLFVLILFLFPIMIFCSIIATRFRDFTQLLISIMQIVYFISPIMWMPNLIGGKRKILLIDFNPVYHFLEITRGIIYHGNFNSSSLLICVLICLITWFLSFVLYKKFENKIIFWI
jgi:ABC-type polysaccharide/polyol phosphate export permease